MPKEVNPHEQIHPSASASHAPTAARTQGRLGGVVVAVPRTQCFDARVLRLLSDASPLRAQNLLALSDACLIEAATSDAGSERARIAAFDSAYLAIAAALPLVMGADTRHPSPMFVAEAMPRLALDSDDRFTLEMLSQLYGRGGWNSLDRLATIEWCVRVRKAACRVYSGNSDKTDGGGRFK